MELFIYELYVRLSLDKEPDNRILACLFAPTIFALVWTTSYKTTRKWILISSVQLVFYGLFFISTLGSSNLDPIIGESARVFLNAVLVSGFLISFFITDIIQMYYMFKWVTAHNLKTYGYKTKSAFRKAQSNIQD